MGLNFVRDDFKRLPVYSITPLEVVAIGLKMGPDKFDRCRVAAFKRMMGEFAVIGDCALRVEVVPPDDARPPEGWLREFCPPKAMRKAQASLDS